MNKTDPRIDAYIAKSADFAKPILTRLRALVHQACPEAEETLKWGMPFFSHHGLLCHMAAFKAHCGLGFWRRKELFDEGKSTSKSQEGALGQFGRITSLADLPGQQVLIAHFKKAAALNEAGPRSAQPARPAITKPLVLPDYFTAALRKNKKAAAAFAEFPPSHQREYVKWVVEAKREETRTKRMASTIIRLSQGKSRNWEYESR